MSGNDESASKSSIEITAWNGGQALAPLICEFDSNAEPIERPSDTDSNPFSLIGEVHLMKKGLPSDDVEGWCSIPIQTDKLEWLTSLLKADSVTLRASFNWGGVDGRAEVLCWSGFHLFVTRPKGSTTSSIQIALTGIESYVGPIAPAGLQQFCHILASNGADSQSTDTLKIDWHPEEAKQPPGPDSRPIPLVREMLFIKQQTTELGDNTPNDWCSLALWTSAHDALKEMMDAETVKVWLSHDVQPRTLPPIVFYYTDYQFFDPTPIDEAPCNGDYLPKVQVALIGLVETSLSTIANVEHSSHETGAAELGTAKQSPDND